MMNSQCSQCSMRNCRTKASAMLSETPKFDRQDICPDFEEKWKAPDKRSDRKNQRSVMTRVRRCDIYMTDLTGDPLERHGKVRPVIIIQNDKGNQSSDSFIAAIITSRPKKSLPTHITLGTDCGLRKNSTVLCEHIVTVKAGRLIKYMGTIAGTKDESRLNKALCISLQIRRK